MPNAEKVQESVLKAKKVQASVRKALSDFLILNLQQGVDLTKPSEKTPAHSAKMIDEIDPRWQSYEFRL